MARGVWEEIKEVQPHPQKPLLLPPYASKLTKPRPLSFCKNAVETQQAWSFGKNALLHRSEMPDLKKVRAAIISVGDKEANLIREQLYRCSFPLLKGSMADLGNFRKADAAMLISVPHGLLLASLVSFDQVQLP